jgi:hypothetical protein
MMNETRDYGYLFERNVTHRNLLSWKFPGEAEKCMKQSLSGYTVLSYLE